MTTYSLKTVVFVDLVGSSAAYETFGSERAADTISRITQWIERVCQAHGGHIIKFLGDGALACFSNALQAVEMAIVLQQTHAKHFSKRPQGLNMGMKIGMATGHVVERGADTYGEPINLAARLSDMAGADTIWADSSVIAQLQADQHASPSGTNDSPAPLKATRHRSLGMMRVRGMAQARAVFQIEWSDAVSTDMMTVPGVLHGGTLGQASAASITLAWLDTRKSVSASQLPLVIGRTPDSGFAVSDPRVSRQHARIDWMDRAFVLSDLSSFGCWVRFAEDPKTEIHLRRSQCVLHSMGEIALGSPFSDFSAPVVTFKIQAGDLDAGESDAATRGLFEDSGTD